MSARRNATATQRVAASSLALQLLAVFSQSLGAAVTIIKTGATTPWTLAVCGVDACITKYWRTMTLMQTRLGWLESGWHVEYDLIYTCDRSVTHSNAMSILIHSLTHSLTDWLIH